MKKLLFVLLTILAVSCNKTANSQTLITMFGSTSGTNVDTLNDAGTIYFTTATNALNANKTSDYRIQFKATNVSGTSTFRVILQGSLDGTNWTNIHQVEGTNGINCDTLQVTALVPAFWVFNVRKRAIKSLTSSTYLHTNAGRFNRLRIAVVGTGTQKTTISSVFAINEL